MIRHDGAGETADGSRKKFLSTYGPWSTFLWVLHQHWVEGACSVSFHLQCMAPTSTGSPVARDCVGPAVPLRNLGPRDTQQGRYPGPSPV
jgi:hypothetical protein